MRIQAVGVAYRSKETEIEDVYSDELALPVAAIRAERHALAVVIDQQVRLTEDVSGAVGTLAANLALAAGERGKGYGARDRAKERFFAVVDDPFRAWLAQVDGNEDARDLGQRWKDSLRRYALAIQDELVTCASSSAIVGRDTDRGYMNVGLAESYFRSALDKLVPAPDNKQEGTK